jgi:hypothetical protein
LPKEDEIASYLGRDSFPAPNPYSECGFLAFNLENSGTISFLRDFKDLYCSGEIFEQLEWHDSFLFDVMRRRYEIQGNRFRNISGDSGEVEHPFIHSHLGKYFDHLKGPMRKVKGTSR